MAQSMSEGDDIIAGINITPLVDIVLVILVIFVVTASFVLKSTVPVNLPQAASAEESAGALIALVVTEKGELYIDGRPASLDEIPGAVDTVRRRLAGTGKAPSAIVSADTSSRYGDFATIVDRLRLAGVTDIALDTRPPDAKAGR
jgi:biopolymer transport protein ExbD